VRVKSVVPSEALKLSDGETVMSASSDGFDVTVRSSVAIARAAPDSIITATHSAASAIVGAPNAKRRLPFTDIFSRILIGIPFCSTLIT
jgi:hypothetical protein